MANIFRCDLCKTYDDKPKANGKAAHLTISEMDLTISEMDLDEPSHLELCQSCLDNVKYLLKSAPSKV